MLFGVKKTGKVLPKNSSEVKGSFFGIGLEKLDRDLYNPTNAYDKLYKLGVKKVRIQSGWAKTEKTKGVYDFLWLDEVVDSLISRSMQPWICLCYGNPLYTEGAKDAFGCVNFPPSHTEEEKEAWIKYCIAVVKHFKGRVNEFEIWNEPEWLWYKGEGPEKYGKFACMTAKAIKEEDPNAYIIAGSLTFINAEWVEKMFSTGLNKYTDAVSYHRYSAYLENILKDLPPMCEAAEKYGVNDIIQGESGCQSAPFGKGALWEGGWNEDLQVKAILRRGLIDLKTKVKFSSYFTAVDVQEALIDVVGEAYFGLLKNKYDKNGKATGEYTEKPSYYAMQNMIAVLSGNPELTEVEMNYTPEWSYKYYVEDENGKDFITQWFKRPNGSYAFVYYKPTPIVAVAFNSTTSFEVKGITGTPKLTDLYTGEVYEFDNESVSVKDDCIKFKNIPVKDYPMVLTFGDFFDILKD